MANTADAYDSDDAPEEVVMSTAKSSMMQQMATAKAAADDARDQKKRKRQKQDEILKQQKASKQSRTSKRKSADVKEEEEDDDEEAEEEEEADEDADDDNDEHWAEEEAEEDDMTAAQRIDVTRQGQSTKFDSDDDELGPVDESAYADLLDDEDYDDDDHTGGKSRQQFEVVALASRNKYTLPPAPPINKAASAFMSRQQRQVRRAPAAVVMGNTVPVNFGSTGRVQQGSKRALSKYGQRDLLQSEIKKKRKKQLDNKRRP
ncbi:hypothetical protein RI367_001764 [Sorochytrium milnesiophthora]